ncbi:MAG: 23S rRNA (uracil(1939)-C(5))-methyltransferase RlmD [Pseudomonadales bacterium]|nr:23S rRNA (uracil(1939)-C(5))-methyltransferase RlmD [Pseudomonadales bacterium]NRA14364.1 23S rRNA (uracil(1939)-C(5))-methyltransferase RlmD [Oceanospirillaceae bacterium]
MSRNKIQFGRPKSRKVKLSELILDIDNLSLEGRGVAKHAGKTVFVDGALPGERVRVKITKQHKSYDEASLVNIEFASSERITAACQHYNHCGGCQLQHLAPTAQLQHKQDAVLALLQHMAKIEPVEIAPPLSGEAFNYRRSARIGVNRLSQSATAIVGFRRRHSSKLLQISNCIVLPQHLSGLFDQLRSTLELIENAKAITHIEYLQGDDCGALTFRCKATLSADSQTLLSSLLKKFKLQGFLRYDQGIEPLSGNTGQLSYSINGLRLNFQPGDFLQVNASVNQQMVDRAMDWLALDDTDKVLDLFSGLGNFSLPIANKVAKLVGIEGRDTMVQRATDNAANNQINNCQFYSGDLSAEISQQPWFAQPYNKIILDPPRSGAQQLIKNLMQRSDAGEAQSPSHILYIACDPSSLARDAQLLASLGYQMQKFCVMDMFPNTAHIEAMALFCKVSAQTKARKSSKLIPH